MVGGGRGIRTAISDIGVLVGTLEIDEVLEDSGLDEITVKLGDTIDLATTCLAISEGFAMNQKVLDKPIAAR